MEFESSWKVDDDPDGGQDASKGCFYDRSSIFKNEKKKDLGKSSQYLERSYNRLFSVVFVRIRK